MKIEIQRFCKYQDFTAEFPSFKICLLDGSSGQGKTTIFEAIRFCLYGGNSNIYPNGEKSLSENPSRVKIELPECGNMTIERIKPPEILKVKLLSKKKTISLEGEAAQEHIFSVFGNYSMFCATCYMAQGNRHPLLSLSNKEKFDLLSLLTFGIENDDHPDCFIERTEYFLKEISSRLDKKLTQRETLLSGLKIPFFETSFDEIDKKYKRIEEITILIETLEDEYEKMIKLENTEKNICSELQNISSDIKKYKKSIIPKCNWFDNCSDCENSFKLYKEISKKEVEKCTQPEYSLQEIEKLEHYLENIDEINVKLSALLEKAKKYDFKIKNIENFSEYISLRKYRQKLPPLPAFYIEKENVVDISLSKCYELNKSIDEFPTFYLNIDLQNCDFKKRLSLEQELNEIKTFFTETEMEEDEIVEIISFLEKEIEIYKKCKKLGIEKDNDLIKEKILEFQTHLSNQEKYIRFNKITEKIKSENENLKKVNDKLSRLNNDNKKILEFYEVSSKEDCESRIGQSFSCPECHSSLVLKNGCLHPLKGNSIPENKAVLLLEYFEKKNKYTEKISGITKNISFLEDEVSTLTYGPIIDSQKIFKILEELKTCIHEKKYETNSSKDAEEKLSLFRNTLKRNNLCKELEKYPLLSDEMKNDKNFEKNIKNAINFIKNFERVFSKNINNKKDFLHKIIRDKETFSIQEEFISIYEEISLLSSYDYPEYDDVSISDLEKAKNFLEKYDIEKTILEKNKEKILEKCKNYPSLNIKEYKKQIKEYEEYKKILSNISSLEEKIPLEHAKELFEDLSLTLISESFKNKEKIKNLLERKEEYEDKYQKITLQKTKDSSICKKEITELRKEDFELRIEIENSEKCLEIQKYNKRIKKLEDKKNASLRLKMISMQSRNMALQKFVFEFNNLVNKICEELFSDPITISLQLEKQNKSNEKIRSFINFGIFYKGNEFDSSNYLSGGEKDRLSLALMIAISLIWGSKIVILDECLSSLNEELRLICIQVLNKYLPGKTVVNVCHSVTQGFHDCVFKI